MSNDTRNTDLPDDILSDDVPPDLKKEKLEPKPPASLSNADQAFAISNPEIM